jgi:hypothetical protein
VAAEAAERGCLDVTLSLQFQVQEGGLSLTAGACKEHLLGFADLYPEGEKHLYVLYKYADSYYEAEGVLGPIYLANRLSKRYCSNHLLSPFAIFLVTFQEPGKLQPSLAAQHSTSIDHVMPR